MAAGDVIVVECTDPLSAIDIPNLLNQTGDVLEASERGDGLADLPHPQGLSRGPVGRQRCRHELNLPPGSGMVRPGPNPLSGRRG